MRGSAVSPAQWEEHVDPSSGKKFFFNPATQETSWTRPNSRAGYPPDPARKSDGWTEHRDPASGKMFYFNTDTKQTSWHKPGAASSSDPWTEHVDPDSGRKFYYNSTTKESAWMKPVSLADRSVGYQKGPDVAKSKPLAPPAAPAPVPPPPTSPTRPSIPAPPAQRVAPGPSPVAPPQWEEHVDSSGRRFFYNPVTQESCWSKPGSASSAVPRPPASPVPPPKRSDGWTEHRDPASGKLFYFNTETKETSWQKPGDAQEWTEHVDESGRTFYYNSQTKESSWSKPVAKDDWEEHADQATGRKFFHNRQTGQSSWERPIPDHSDAGEGLQLLCFDFDCTIAAIHVFEEALGSHLKELCRRGGFDGPSQKAKLEVQCREEPEFPSRIYGGPGRLQELRSFFQSLLQTPRRKVIVITTGFGNVVDAALAKGGLRKFFAEVIGREHPLSEAKQGRKDRIIEELRRRDGLSEWQVLFVDDDPGNVLPAAEQRLCRTVWVPRPVGGMDSMMLRLIREAAEDDTGKRSRGMFREDLSLAAGAPSAAASARSLRQAFEGAHWDVLVWSLKASRFQAVEAVKRAAMRRWLGELAVVQGTPGTSADPGILSAQLSKAQQAADCIASWETGGWSESVPEDEEVEESMPPMAWKPKVSVSLEQSSGRQLTEDIDAIISDVVNQAIVKKAIQGAVSSCKFCVTIADPRGKDFPLIAVSEAFENMTGFKRSEILGANCRFLNQGCPISPSDLVGLRLASERGCAFTALLPNRKKSGEMFINLLDLRGLTIATDVETNEELSFEGDQSPSK
ncbi:PRPF40A [Symbiodinium sp. KB8]|nr:PRPF40A [Symbiodinium sp. KB8]